MKYFKQYREENAKVEEITKVEAINLLGGHYYNLDEVLDSSSKEHKIRTSFVNVWKEEDKIDVGYGKCAYCDKIATMKYAGTPLCEEHFDIENEKQRKKGEVIQKKIKESK